MPDFTPSPEFGGNSRASASFGLDIEGLDATTSIESAVEEADPRYLGTLPGVTSVQGADLTPRSGALVAKPGLSEKAQIEMWRRVKDLELKGRANDAAALTAALLERYYKEVSTPNAEMLQRKYDMEEAEDRARQAASPVPIRKTLFPNEAAAAEKAAATPADAALESVKTAEEKAAVDAAVLSAPPGSPPPQMSAAASASPGGLPASPGSEFLPDGIWRGHYIAKGGSATSRNPIAFSLFFVTTQTIPHPAGNVNGVEHDDKAPNKVVGSFTENGRLVMQKTHATTNKTVKFVGTFHAGKIAGTWQDEVPGGSEGTFLLTHQPDEPVIKP